MDPSQGVWQKFELSPPSEFSSMVKKAKYDGCINKTNKQTDKQRTYLPIETRSSTNPNKKLRSKKCGIIMKHGGENYLGKCSKILR